MGRQCSGRKAASSNKMMFFFCSSLREWQKLTVASREQRFPAKHLGEDAAHAPDINRTRILLESEHHFGSTIPSVRKSHVSDGSGTKPVWKKGYLVATYSVMKVLVSSTFGGGRADLARPKSHSLKLQLKRR